MTGAPHWTWGLFTAIGLTLSLHYISKQRRWPHLLGMAVNLMSVLFGGFLYGQTTFYFLIIPAGMFLRNWLKYPARMRALREQAEELARLRAQGCARCRARDERSEEIAQLGDRLTKMLTNMNIPTTPVDDRRS